MPVSEAQFKIGDLVDYRPIGGTSKKVPHSKGKIEKVFEIEDGTVRYAIYNQNTGKTSNYQESSIVGKIDPVSD